MITKQTIHYFNQLESSTEDKMRIWPYIQGRKVLDAGCGFGSLMKVLQEEGYAVKGIDSSWIAFNEIKKTALKKNFVHGDLKDMASYFNSEEFDTIIFSSVLHEVYSYNDFNKETLFEVLESAYKILRPGGRIIIRDGVKPESCSNRIIRFKDKNDVLFLKEFCKRFKDRRVSFSKLDSVTYEMNEADAMEFLYTYTWGWDSFDREVQEAYGVFSLTEYCSAIKAVLPNSKVKFAKSYLQPGYRIALTGKVEYLDNHFNKCELPDSNMILVLEKEY